MKRGLWKASLLVVTITAVFGALLFASSADNVKVISMERHMNKIQTGLNDRDCYITGLSQSNKRVSGYAPSSFCSSVKIGDTVVIKENIVTRK